MNFVSQKVTKKITLLKSKWETTAVSKLTPVSVLFMPFMGSQPKHHKQYIKLCEDFYRPSKRPVEILVAQANFLDFLSISRGKSLSSNIFDAIEEHFNPTSKLLAHTMSVGTFLHAVNFQYDHKNLYRDRLAGQIFDSPVYGGNIQDGGLERIIDGIIEMSFSNSKLKNPVTRQLLMKAARLAILPNATVFDKYITTFISKGATAPILAFYSKNDVMVDPIKYDVVIKEWKSKGVNVHSTCFENSVHAQHIIHEPELFKYNFVKFLSSLEL